MKSGNYYYNNDGDSEESVYNLIEKPVTHTEKTTMYRSKYPSDTPPTSSTFGLKNTSKPGVANLAGQFIHPDFDGGGHTIQKECATMGRTTKHHINPMNYTKKSEKSMPQPQRFTYSDEEIRKPKVPLRNDKPIMGLTTDKNFIVSNAVENILSQPKSLQKGEPNWLAKSEFGKSPAYLSKIKQEIMDEYEYIQEMQDHQHNRGNKEMRALSDKDRDALIEQLKDKWATLQKKYQGISFSMPTDKVHVQRKEALEAEMDKIEKDIEKLSRRHIFVVDE
ncbi:enkurin [Acrasis kona]|uniref:Enkurin n=1 Tax=Acrasis kona TaxID=1008807 RepID=A0AAW2YLC9_9EUKA